MPFQPFTPDEPQARKVVMYTQPVDTTVHHTCVLCDAPVRRSGGLCRGHYYWEAVNHRGKHVPGHGFLHRPGQWLPPIIALFTALTSLLVLQRFGIFFVIFVPMFMWGWVFGMKNKRSGRNGTGTGVPSMLQGHGPNDDWRSL